MRGHILEIRTIIFIALTFFVRYVFSVYDDSIIDAISLNCIWAIIVYAWLFYCCLQKSSQYVNLYSLFLLLSFLFFFGQHLVVLTGKADVMMDYHRSILDHRIPNESRISVGYFILIVLLVVNIGVLSVPSSFKKRSLRLKRKRPLLYDKYTARVALFVFLIVLVPTFIKHIHTAVNTQTMGYSDAMEENENVSGFLKLCYFLSYYFLPMLYILIINYAKSRKLYIFLLIYVLFVVIYLGTGSRFRLFESMIAILLIYNSRIRQIGKKELIKIAIGGCLLLLVFSIVRESRESVIISGGDPLMAISLIWEKLSEQGLFTAALMETGQTFQVIDVVFYNCPDHVPYINGFSIVASFLMLLPSFLIEGNLDVVNVSKVFSPIYEPEIQIGMGSSFIAEGFYNFGFISLIYFFIIGRAIGILLSKADNIYKEGVNFNLFQYAYISSLLCFGVRTDLVSFLRYYIYYVLFFQIIINILYKIGLRYTKKYEV